MEILKEVYDKHERDCNKTIESFKKDLKKVRSGRASSSLIENIMVEHYGSKTPLMHLGQISSPEARLLTVQIFDASAVEACDKAIRSADLGLNPSVEGNVLRIIIPPLTEETRKDIVRSLGKRTEEIRISIRNHRRDANESIKKLEKGGDVGKDDSKKAQDNIQTATNDTIKKVDQMLKDKEAECMAV